MGNKLYSNMQRVFIALAVIAVATALPVKLSENDYESLFKSFVTEHNKVYQVSEMEIKFRTFKDNMDFIFDHNANHADRLGYTVGVNQFADMTSNEFKRTMTGYKPLQKPKFAETVLDVSAAPAAVDWTTKNAVTPVKNQDQCGSCWAFSTTGSVEGVNAIATGKLESFSEQQLVDCAGSFGNQGCNGGLMDDGFKYIEKNGDSLEADYGYTGKGGTCQTSKVKSAVTISGFTDVPSKNEAQLMAAVAINPVSVAIEADQSGFQFYKSGVFSGTCGTSLDHGVLVVGYGVDGGKNYWKVKNSWGATWDPPDTFSSLRTSLTPAASVESPCSHHTQRRVAQPLQPLQAARPTTATQLMAVRLTSKQFKCKALPESSAPLAVPQLLAQLIFLLA